MIDINLLRADPGKVKNSLKIKNYDLDSDLFIEIESKRSVLFSLKDKLVISISDVSGITFIHRKCFDDHDEGVDNQSDR